MVVKDRCSECSLVLSTLYDDLLGGAGIFLDFRAAGDVGGVGVEIRSGYSFGITSDAGPIMERRIGKRKVHLQLLCQ